MNTTTNTSFPAQVWDKLSRIDVGDHIETANIKSQTGASYSYEYLNWAWCWASLMSCYPETKLAPPVTCTYPDKTVMVWVELEIIEGDCRLTRKMFLPVMDRKYNSIVNPTSRQISDTMQRCFVKCAAVCGLGLDLWTQSDMPVGTIDDPLTDDQLAMISGLLVKAGADLTDDADSVLTGFLKYTGSPTVTAIPRKKYKTALSVLERKVKNVK